MFANDIAMTNLDRAVRAALEIEVLRQGANNRPVADLVMAPQSHAALDHGMRLHDRSRPDFDLGSDAGVRPDLDFLA